MYQNATRQAVEAAQSCLDSVGKVSMPSTETLTNRTAANLQRAVEKINAALSAGSIIKSSLAEVRSNVNYALEETFKAKFSKPYLDSRDMDDSDLEEAYYGRPEAHTFNGKMKKLEKLIGRADYVAGAVAALNEYKPIIDALEALKGKVTTTQAVREEKKAEAAKAKAAIPPTKLSAIVAAAVDAHKPELEKDYIKYITDTYNRLVEHYGGDFEGIHKERRNKFFDNTLVPVMTKKKLDQQKLKEKAQQYAQNVGEAMKGKIMVKAGDLDNPEIKSMNGYGFIVTGEYKGKSVRIEQQIIVNQSVRGTLFNQFPARIRYDGKGISEAAYKTLMQ